MKGKLYKEGRDFVLLLDSGRALRGSKVNVKKVGDKTVVHIYDSPFSLLPKKRTFFNLTDETVALDELEEEI